MSRTSTTLLRLGVPSLAAATMLAGVPAVFGAGTAQAQTAQTVGTITITPVPAGDNTAAAGSCKPFTIDVAPATGSTASTVGQTINVILTDAAGSATSNASFCTLPQGGATPQQGTVVSSNGAQTGGGSTDQSEFTLQSNPDATGDARSTGRAVIGVTRNEANTGSTSVAIQAFFDQNNDNAFNAGEQQANNTAVFTAGGPAGSNANQDAARSVEVIDASDQAASPTVTTVNDDTDTAIEGETRTFRVRVTNAANTGGDVLNGVTVNFTVNSGDDTADRGSAVFGTTDNNGIATGTITFPTRATAGNTTDEVTFFVNQSTGRTGGPDAAGATTNNMAEPTDTVVVTVRDSAAQQNRTVQLRPEARTVVATERSATFTAVVDDPRSTGATDTTGTELSFTVTGGSGDEFATVDTQTAGGNRNECTTGADFDDPDQTGTDEDTNDSSCVVTVNDPTPVVGQTLTVTATVRGTTQSDTSTLTFTNRPQDARNISIAPQNPTTAPNTARTITATVVDSQGNPVAGVEVTFTESGAGAFRNGSSTVDVTTNAQGVATVETISLPGETGTQTVTATITERNTQCTQAAGAGNDPQNNNLNSTGNPGTEAAGVCADSSTVTFGAASPSPSASATPTAGTTSPSPSNTASPGTPPGCQVAAARLERTTITATGSSGVTVTAAPNSVVELFAYTRPSTTFRLVRSAEVGADGVAEFRITPPANTRLQARQQGCAFGQSIVLNVRTAISLIVKRNGPRLYTFSGDSLPARPGGLIVSLFRVTNDGRQILAAQTRADASTGTYSIRRQFTGGGRFGFVVRTGQDLQNAPGSSNVRSLAVF